MASINDLRAAKRVIRSQVLQLGLGGQVIGRRPTLSVHAAVGNAGRNVHAVGIGRKRTAENTGNDLAVRLYVVQKLPESLLSPRDRLPTEINGIPTDVVEADPAYLLVKRRSKKPAPAGGPKAAAASCSTRRREKQRPVVAGISAGHRDITAGTLGTFCRSMRLTDDPSATYVLSNNHVFANVNAALIGDPLYQQGPADGGTYLEHFANLHRFVEIQMGGVTPNRVDAALGILLGGVGHVPEICSIGEIVGTKEPEAEMLVRKHGRTTGYSEGKIDDIEYDALVGMDHNDPSVVALFEDQLRIVTTTSEPFGLGGDSGSAVVDRTEAAIVGLYFAGPASGTYGVANKIDHVLTELEIGIP
ncbi:hypothetical protein Pan216_42500 [Planctomycetes bacterium Pan216]|uniref:Trypsin n=1 Tax=Kolteria novifilia TaxID=2527975 RepID=A0A518B8U7_9BACT|nr:hypothetical protein Pan216_42500 [Planctomycetes bacterium Pan216]